MTRAGIPTEQVMVVADIYQLISAALDWARTGDVLVLPIHAMDERDAVIELLERVVN